ncbi:uncharacterized protein LOC117646377 isoform X2 [Thrips palmi]|uniref:Uncharacterized protein LOC117646377 isoform X2 n=1 Tax=Thrips palmi TaxID=161013 RepID=A0A6P8YZQ2_THRPL|nr:uncharacterized protein LOC117646377 isoform X2 [Thrips palmi]
MPPPRPAPVKAARSCGPPLPPAPAGDMVSRRRILSRSRDDLNLDSTFVAQQEEEEDVWYNKDKLYKDHIQEVLDKWTQIDDEIWAKVIVLERNRRVAKAYARAPVLTVNGSDDGFDGFRIGLCGFDNPMRDQKTDELKRHIGHGIKVKMDDQGNILVKRVSKCNVYVKSTAQGDETAIGNDVLKLPNCALELEKPVKLFDMKKFQQNVSRELRRAYPDRRRLECQCLSAVAFVRAEPDLLDCPIWILVINVVAMDMLKSKLPPVKRVVDIRNRPRIPIPDEDPYSVAGSGGSSGSSSGARESAQLQQQPAPQGLGQHKLGRRSDKPPKLPPRDNTPYPHDIPKVTQSPRWSLPHIFVSKPDYDDIEDENRLKPFASSRGQNKKDAKKFDDPYYCGLRARVPNFVKSKSGKEQQRDARDQQAQQQQQRQAELLHSLHNPYGRLPLPGNPHFLPPPPHQPHMWHARSYDSGMDSEALDSPYNHIYGRLRIPTRAYIPPQPRTMYIGEWD